MQTRPTLLNACAKATTAAEARFRIDVPIKPSRATRIVALDDGAALVVREVAAQTWASARFYVWDPRAARAGNGSSGGPELLAVDGSPAALVDELVGVDVVVMIATSASGAVAASVIGTECTARGIMTAGLILGEGPEAGEAVAALRPHARFIIVSADQHDVSEVLTALRA